MTEHTASETDVPVLIAGGSLVGMTMAVLLGHRGIPTIVAAVCLIKSDTILQTFGMVI